MRSLKHPAALSALFCLANTLPCLRIADLPHLKHKIDDSPTCVTKSQSVVVTGGVFRRLVRFGTPPTSVAPPDRRGSQTQTARSPTGVLRLTRSTHQLAAYKAILAPAAQPSASHSTCVYIHERKTYNARSRSVSKPGSRIHTGCLGGAPVRLCATPDALETGNGSSCLTYLEERGIRCSHCRSRTAITLHYFPTHSCLRLRVLGCNKKKLRILRKRTCTRLRMVGTWLL